MSTKENMPEMIAKWSADLGIPLEPWQREMIARIYGNRARGMASAYTLSRNGQLLERIKRDLAEAEREHYDLELRAERKRSRRLKLSRDRLAGYGLPLAFALGAFTQWALVTWLGHV